MIQHIGKIIGATAGVGISLTVLGGLIGFLLGSLLDVFYRFVVIPVRNKNNIKQNISLAIIALHAKLAKADGSVSAAEIKKFRQLVDIQEADEDAVGHIFNMARNTIEGYSDYAFQLAELLYNHNIASEDLVAILTSLYQLAIVGGEMSETQRIMLRDIASIFGFSNRDIELMEQAFNRKSNSFKQDFEGSNQSTNKHKNKSNPFTESAIGDRDPYKILDVDIMADLKEIKRKYRQLIRENHPDKLKGEGKSPKKIKQAEKYMAEINAAYAEIIDKN